MCKQIHIVCALLVWYKPQVSTLSSMGILYHSRFFVLKIIARSASCALCNDPHQGGYIPTAVCLSVGRIVQKLINWFSWNVVEGWDWAKELHFGEHPGKRADPRYLLSLTCLTFCPISPEKNSWVLMKKYLWDLYWWVCEIWCSLTVFKGTWGRCAFYWVSFSLEFLLL